MIHKEFGKFIMECDGCGHETDPHKDFQDMIDEAKATGWLITKDDDDDDTWVHYCTACVADMPSL